MPEKSSLPFLGWGCYQWNCAKELSLKDHFFWSIFPRCPSIQPQTNGVKCIMLWKHRWSYLIFMKITLISTTHSQNWVGSNSMSLPLFLLIELSLIFSPLDMWFKWATKRFSCPGKNNLYLREWSLTVENKVFMRSPRNVDHFSILLSGLKLE